MGSETPPLTENGIKTQNHKPRPKIFEVKLLLDI